MAYNETLVVAGGIAHVPILITVLKFFDGKTSNRQKGAEAIAKKKAKAEAKAKAQAQAAAAAKAAEADAKAAAAKAAAAAAVKTDPPVTPAE